MVQHDISYLWELDLNGRAVGAVVDSFCGQNCCPGRKYEDYLNFSHPIISSNFDRDRCAWLYGMNVFDLEAWRRINITATYHKWLKLVRSFLSFNLLPYGYWLKMSLSDCHFWCDVLFHVVGDTCCFLLDICCQIELKL